MTEQTRTVIQTRLANRVTVLLYKHDECIPGDIPTACVSIFWPALTHWITQGIAQAVHSIACHHTIRLVQAVAVNGETAGTCLADSPAKKLTAGILEIVCIPENLDKAM